MIIFLDRGSEITLDNGNKRYNAVHIINYRNSLEEITVPEEQIAVVVPGPPEFGGAELTKTFILDPFGQFVGLQEVDQPSG